MELRTNITAAAAAALLIAGASMAQEQKVYRWVDEEGNVQYSHTLPPDYKDTGHDVLNERGIVLDEDMKLTPEQVVEAEAAAEEESKGEEDGELPRDSSGLPRPKPLYSEAETQARMDNFLMLRFGSEQEIIDAMNVEIKQLNYDRRLLEGSRDSLNDAYRGQVRIAGNKQRAGVVVSEEETFQIADLQSKLASNARSLAEQDEREKEIQVEFQARLDRYRFLVEKYNENNGQP